MQLVTELPRHHLPRGARDRDLGCGHDDALRPQHGPEHVAGIKRGLAHRQPPRALSAQRATRHGPVVTLAAIDVSVNRRRAIFDAHLRHYHVGAVLVRPRVHRDRVIGPRALPFKMHTVVIQRDARNRRTIAQMRRLVGVNGAHRRIPTVINHQPPAHFADARRLDVGRQRGQPVGVQAGITPAQQHQIARNHPIRDRAGGHHLRLEPVLAAQHLQRIQRRDRLGRAGRRRAGLRVHPLKPQAGLGVRHRITHLPAQIGVGHDNLGACDRLFGNALAAQTRAQRPVRRVGKSPGGKGGRRGGQKETSGNRV